MTAISPAEIFRAVFWAVAHLLGLGAIGLLIWQLGVDFLGWSNVVTDFVKQKIGPLVTIVSLFLVSVSVYFENADRQAPTKLTRHFTAPLMMIVAAAFFSYFCIVNFFNLGTLSGAYVDYLSTLALAGAMLRMVGVPRSIGTV